MWDPTTCIFTKQFPTVELQSMYICYFFSLWRKYYLSITISSNEGLNKISVMASWHYLVGCFSCRFIMIIKYIFFILWGIRNCLWNHLKFLSFTGLLGVILQHWMKIKLNAQWFIWHSDVTRIILYKYQNKVKCENWEICFCQKVKVYKEFVYLPCF